jgi:anti-sigma B factor antagonist
MEITKTSANGTVTLALNGKLSAVHTEEFAETVTAVCAETDTLTIDFGEVSYLSSAGLRVLISAHRNLHARGGSLLISNVRTESVREVFEITGFDRILKIQ